MDATFTDCSATVVSLWAIVSPVPNLFADVQHLICDSQDYDITIISNFMTRARRLRSVLWEWRSRYDRVVLSESDTLDKRYETMGVCLANAIILDRLIVALYPSNAGGLESEAQSLAQQIITVAETATAVNPRAGLFMEFKVSAARAAMTTQHEWYEAICRARSSESTIPIDKKTFERWCFNKGRKLTKT